MVGCGGPKQFIKKQSSRPAAPDWISRLPQDEKNFYVIGTASQARTLKDGKEQARTNAASQIADFVGVKLKSKLNINIQEKSGETKTLVDESVQKKADALIASMQVVDEYYTKTARQAGGFYEEHYEVYLLCRFPKAAAKKERARQKNMAQEKASIALSLFQQSQEDIKSNRLINSLYKLREAEKNLKNVSDVIALGGNNLKTAQELKTAVNMALTELRSRSRSLFIEVLIEGKKNSKSQGAFYGTFSKEIASAGFNTSNNQKTARFSVMANINLRKGGVSFGQQCVYAAYNFEIKDNWSNKTIAGNSGEAKGFAKKALAAAQRAITETAENIGKEVGLKIQKYLQKHLTEEKEQ